MGNFDVLCGEIISVRKIGIFSSLIGIIMNVERSKKIMGWKSCLDYEL